MVWVLLTKPKPPGLLSLVIPGFVVFPLSVFVMKLGLALVAVNALEEVFTHQGWEIDAAPWSRSQPEVNQPVLLLTSRRSHIYVAVPDSLGPTHSKKWTVTICRRLGETLAGRCSPEQLTDQHLTPAPADAGWTRNSWSQSGAPQRQVAPVPYPLSLYTARTLWMPHNSSPPPNLSPRFAFGRSFPRWMLVFSQHRRRFFHQKMCRARDVCFLTNIQSSSSSSIVVTRHCWSRIKAVSAAIVFLLGF